MSSPKVNGFQWPEYYSFPPFFTLQAVPETREKQIEMWRDLITSWAQAQGIKDIHVGDAKNLPLFSNKDINRQLDDADIITVLDAVAADGYGVWVTPDKTIFGISGQRISDIANAIHKWADSVNLINAMSTLEEIANGDEARGEPFYGLPLPLIHSAIQQLAASDRAVLVEGGSLEETGVKFLAL